MKLQRRASTTVRGRHHEGEEINAQVLFHKNGRRAQETHEVEGALRWALRYAATYFDRSEWIRENYFEVEVAWSSRRTGPSTERTGHAPATRPDRIE
jgi:hypothetical protein